MDLFEAMDTARSMRELSSRPVPKELLEKLIHYATRAPSAGNGQPWEFVVVTKPDLIEQIGGLYRQATEEMFTATLNAAETASKRRIYTSAVGLSRSMAKVPALIVVCVDRPMPENPAHFAGRYASIFPAVQNLLLAARGLGLGTVLTTAHKVHEPEIKALLSIPDDVEATALIPVGYPERSFGPLGRRPTTDVIHWDRY